MKAASHRSHWIVVAVLLSAAAALGACQRKDAAPAAPSAATPATGSSGPSPHATIQPQSGDTAPPSKGAGPADASTAVGGVVTNQGSNNAGSGQTSAPTGGDGAASAASPAASK